MPVIQYLCPVANAHIAIWHITEDLPALAMLARHAGFLQPAPHTNQQANRRWYAARLALHQLLLQQYNTPVMPPVIKNAAGKPFLNGSALAISLSHSKSYACALVACTAAAGIDIEEPRANIADIAPRFLSAGELNLLAPNNYLPAFCAKEALYKALPASGLSLRQNLAVVNAVATQLQVRVTPGNNTHVVNLRHESQYTLAWALL